MPCIIPSFIMFIGPFLFQLSLPAVAERRDLLRYPHGEILPRFARRADHVGLAIVLALHVELDRPAIGSELFSSHPFKARKAAITAKAKTYCSPHA
jgi:hypothetical protein